MPLISINGNEIDPHQQANALSAFGLKYDNAAGSDYILIQTSADPLSTEQEAELERLGVLVQEYVSQNTYLCYYKPHDLSAIRELPFIGYADVYLNVFVLQSDLKHANVSNSLAAFSVAPKTNRTRHVDIVLHQGVDGKSEEVRKAVAAAARADPELSGACSHKIRLHVQEQYLDDLAAVDYVRHIHEVGQSVLFNNKATEVMKVETMVNDTQYLGEGQVVAVGDTGFDKGVTDDTHPAFTGRVKHLYALGRPGKADDPDGHGTHVCGSILGDGESKTMGGKIAGAAPKATLVLQSVLDMFNGLGGIPSDLNDLFIVPYDEQGARIHTNSWGATSLFGQIAYDSSATEVDKFVWEHPDMVILFAAGNEGTDRNFDGKIDERQIGSQAGAKNCITVGASENNRPEIPVQYGVRWPSAPFRTDPMANHPEGMAAFSSRGPTKEGRIKPDVVAPGTAILSTHSRNSGSQGNQYGESTDPDWFYMAGTSMATPLVAGCVAVLRETLVKNNVPKPSAALIKALLINGAVELVGQYTPSEAGPSPNASSGFGLVNLKNSIIVPGQQDGGFHEGSPLEKGAEATPLTVNIPADKTGSALKVTLVWSDPPGARLQNDLDLIVRASDGTERHGNMGEKADFDRANNVEQVVWTNIPGGEVQIIVKAFQITRKDFPQPYAVVWSVDRPLK
ncbi:hypothetical protein FQN50_000459 [Emmonsiellopsis sp. PD_5]|nr:hypothetical protein FQN50_000459 [Emmonsiellopsis sp. PD_5]